MADELPTRRDDETDIQLANRMQREANGIQSNRMDASEMAEAVARKARIDGVIDETGKQILEAVDRVYRAEPPNPA